MGFLMRIGFYILLFVLALIILRDWILIPIIIIIVLWLARIIADIYWAGKDNGRW